MPATKEGPRLMGKPSVRFRKVVNTTTDDGQLVAVTAQQYCVLVMDVPDLEAAARRYAQSGLVLLHKRAKQCLGFKLCTCGQT